MVIRGDGPDRFDWALAAFYSAVCLSAILIAAVKLYG